VACIEEKIEGKRECCWEGVKKRPLERPSVVGVIILK